jgi:hypothetical protein
LDYPRLDCRVCQQLYEQGDLAEYPCSLCPVHLMPEPDWLTIKANELYSYLARAPFPEHPPDWHFLFRLVGVEVGSDASRQVYERLLLRLSIEREHRQRQQGPSPPAGNGDGPST